MYNPAVLKVSHEYESWSLVSWEEDGPRVLQNKACRKIFNLDVRNEGQIQII